MYIYILNKEKYYVEVYHKILQINSVKLNPIEQSLNVYYKPVGLASSAKGRNNGTSSKTSVNRHFLFRPPGPK